MVTAPTNTDRMPNTTYKSVRLLSEKYNLFYAVWCTGDHELFDLNVHRLPIFVKLRKKRLTDG
jgi:hypothetical protein